MSNPPIDLASLAAAVTAQTTAIANFVDQQILLYTTTDPTVTVTDANGNPVVIPSWYATVGANQAAVGAMQAQVSANTAAIAAIDTGDTTINAQISALQALQSTHTSNLTSLNASVTGLLSQQDTDVTNITSLQAQVESLEAGGTGNGTAITALQTQVNTNTDAITALQTLTSQNATSIVALQTTVSNNSTALTSLQTSLSTNTTAITTNADAITAINTAMAALTAQQNTDVANISANAGNIQTNTTALATLNDTVGSFSSTLTALQTNVTSVSNAIAANNTTVSGVQAAITALQSQESNDITTLNTALANNVTALNALTTQVGNLPTPGAYSPPYVANRFFTQVFMDRDGRLLGGISRVSGKLWLNNGGWLSERLDELEAQTMLQNLVYNDINNAVVLQPPSIQRYTQIFGSLTPSTTSQSNAMAAVYGGFTNAGDLEINGVSLAKTLAQIQIQQATLPMSKTMAGLTGSSTIVSDSTMVGVVDNFAGGVRLISPSQTSTQLAARVGATPVLLSVTNRTILSSGATTVTGSQVLDSTNTLHTVYPITADSPSQSIVGTLNNIPGTLTRGASDSDLTFTPTVTLGANVFIGDNTPFLPSDAAQSLSNTLMIAVGRNNLTDLPTVMRDIAAIINAIPLVNVSKRYIVVTPFNWAAEDNTTTNGQAIIALEQMIQFAYPNNSFNTRQFLQNTYAALGAGDAATYFGNGLIPASYFSGDNETLTSTAQGYLSSAITNALAISH